MTSRTRASGSCQCGDIRYLAPSTPLELYVCHCKECQKQSSSAFGISYTVPRNQFEVTHGEPLFWARVTLSGKTLTCAFCRNCGSRLWHQSTGTPDTLNVKAGTFDAPVDLTSAVHIWVSSKLPGIEIPRGAVCFEKEPS